MRVTVAFPVAALAAAVMVVFCAVPGVRFSVDGLAVTPDGRPLKFTFTDPLNPFVGVALTETTCPVAPCVTAMLEGAVDSVKSGVDEAAAATVRAKVAECFSDRAVPAKVTVAFPTAAFAEALRVTLCAVPGVRLSVDGLAVTPAGNPLNLTFTVPLKPVLEAAFTETVLPAPPCVTVKLAGDKVRAKPRSAGAACVTESAKVAVCVTDVAAPVTVTFASPVVAPLAAVRVTLCAVPGVRLNVDGLAVTPLGRPLRFTFTEPLKPFTGTAFTKIVLPVPPCCTAILAGARDKVKSGAAVVGVTVRPTVAECVTMPELAVMVTVALAADAPPDAESTTVCGLPPGVRVSADGDAVTPAGSPPIATLTGPLKPLMLVADRVKFCVAPTPTATLLDPRLRLKSGRRVSAMCVAPQALKRTSTRLQSR